jgi:hypothetical protein
MSDNKVRVDLEINAKTDEGARKVDSFVNQTRQKLDRLMKQTGTYSDIAGAKTVYGANAGPILRNTGRAIEDDIAAMRRQYGNLPELQTIEQRYQRSRNAFFNQAVAPSATTGLAGVNLATLPITPILRAQLENLKAGNVTDPKQREAMRDIAGRFLGELQSKQKEVEDATITGLLTQYKEISELPEDEMRKRLEGLNKAWSEHYDVMGKNRMLTKGFREEYEKLDESVTKRGRMLPSYMTALVSAGMEGANALATIYAAKQTMFDLSSPRAMADALARLGILETKTAWSTSGKFLGMGAGALLGGALGGGIISGALMGTAIFPGVGTVGGAIAGAFLGGEVFGDIGNAIGTIATADQERRLKIFDSLFSKGQSDVDQAAGYQRTQYLLKKFKDSPATARGLQLGYGPEQTAQLQLAFNRMRGGANVNSFADILSLARSVGLGDHPEQLLPLVSMFKYTNKNMPSGMIEDLMSRTGMGLRAAEFIPALMNVLGQATQRFMNPESIQQAGGFAAQIPTAIFGTTLEYGRLGPEGLQSLNTLQGLMNPKSEAQQAFIFRALRGANPRAGVLDTILQARQGIMDKGNLMAILRTIPRNEQLAKAYFMAMMPDASKEMIDKLSRDQSSGLLLREIGGITAPTGVSDKDFILNQDMLNRGMGMVSPGEANAAAIQSSNVTTGLKLQQRFLEINLEWNATLNDMTTMAGVVKDFQDRLRAATGEMNKIKTGLDSPTVITPSPAVAMSLATNNSMLKGVRKDYGTWHAPKGRKLIGLGLGR